MIKPLNTKVTRSVYLLGVLLLLSSVAIAKEELNLYVGDMRVLRLGLVKRVAIGNGKLISTTAIESGQLLVLADAPGETELKIWLHSGQQREYKVRVVQHDLIGKIYELRALTKDLAGVKLRRIGKHIVAEGAVDAQGKALVEKLVKMYEPDFVDLTEPVQIRRGKMVQMHVQITEFSTSVLNDLGINWQVDALAGPAIGFAGEIIPGDSISSVLDNPLSGSGIGTHVPVTDATKAFGYFGIATNVSSFIRLAKNSGDALVLAEPTLSARSGGQAKFLSGGEIPVQQIGADGTPYVEFKEFGIKLEISPSADDRGNIVADVLTEVSTVDPSLAVGNVPGFRTRRASTQASLRDGQTLVISGLVNSRTAGDTSGVRGLQDIPILGALFRSTSFTNEKTELVIFVTPYIYDEDSVINKATVKYADELRKQFFQAVNKSEDLLD